MVVTVALSLLALLAGVFYGSFTHNDRIFNAFLTGLCPYLATLLLVALSKRYEAWRSFDEDWDREGPQDYEEDGVTPKA